MQGTPSVWRGSIRDAAELHGQVIFIISMADQPATAASGSVHPYYEAASGLTNAPDQRCKVDLLGPGSRRVVAPLVDDSRQITDELEQ
jgi:hypothetical protein